MVCVVLIACFLFHLKKEELKFDLQGDFREDKFHFQEIRQVTNCIKYGRLNLKSRQETHDIITALALALEDTDPVELKAKIEKCTS